MGWLFLSWKVWERLPLPLHDNNAYFLLSCNTQKCPMGWNWPPGWELCHVYLLFTMHGYKWASSHSVYMILTGYRHDGISPDGHEEHIKCGRFSSSGKDIWKVRFYHGYCCTMAPEAQGCSAPGKQPGDFDLGSTVLSSSLERQGDPPLLMAKEHRGKASAEETLKGRKYSTDTKDESGWGAEPPLPGLAISKQLCYCWLI